MTNKTDFLYYKVGSSKFNLHLDIFDVPEGLDPEEHLNFLNSLFLQVVGDTTSPQMSRLIYVAVETTLKQKGSFKDFIRYLEHPARLGLIGAHLELSSSGVINRILPLTTGVAGTCFNTKSSNIDYKTLINNNVIIDLSPFEDTENNTTRKIFVNVLYYYLLHFVRRTRPKIRDPKNIQNILVVEEAQKILPVSYEGRTEIRSMLGMSTWTARAYGISMVFVGTDPVVESSILTNTGITILFYSKTDTQQMSRLLNMSLQTYQNYLPILRNRQFFLVINKSRVQLCKSLDFELSTGEDLSLRVFEMVRNRI